jgi:D,D-heptose 1,7-bisphosphate phosphatase
VFLSLENSSPTIKHLVILAGGKGTRLESVALNLPKILVHVAGKSVLEHQLDSASACGVTKVIIFAGYQGEQIKVFVGDGHRFEMDIRVVVEEEPFGTAGAVLQSLDSLPEHFFVVYGDVVHAVDLQRLAKLHLARQSDFTVLVHPNDHPHDSDLLEINTEGWVTKVHACPHPPDRFFNNLVNAGIYVVRREALRPWVARSGKQDFTKTLLSGLVETGGRVLAYRSNEYAKDMGTPDRLRRVEADWQKGKIGFGQASQVRPAIFLDRDGTLNVEKGFLSNHESLELIAGAGDALKTLREAGFYLVVLTNQPVIARGEASEDDVAAINRRMEWELGKEGAYLDGIYVCPHHPESGFPGERSELKISCNCRKPNTGLLERACGDMPIDIAGSWMIGDRTMDIEMARRAGLRSILVQSGPEQNHGRSVEADYIADDLLAAATVILRNATLPVS